MNDEESHSESEFYYPEDEEQAETEQTTWAKLAFTKMKILVAVKRNYKSLFKNRKVKTLWEKRQVTWSVFIVFLAR